MLHKAALISKGKVMPGIDVKLDFLAGPAFGIIS
jgi:hypothetical protein